MSVQGARVQGLGARPSLNETIPVTTSGPSSLNQKSFQEDVENVFNTYLQNESKKASTAQNDPWDNRRGALRGASDSELRRWRDQIVFFDSLDLYQKSPDSSERQYKSST